MSLGTIFVIVLIGAVIFGIIKARFMAGFSVALFLTVFILGVKALLPYLPSALSAIFHSGIIPVLIIGFIIIFVCQKIFG